MLWLCTLGVLLSLTLAYMLNGVSSISANARPAEEAAAIELDPGPVVNQNGRVTPEDEQRIAPNPLSELAGLGVSPNRSFRVESLRPPRFEELGGMILSPWKMLSDTVAGLFPLKGTFLDNVLALIWLIGSLGLWAWIGGAATRTAGLQLTLNRHEPWGQVQGFVNRRWKSYCNAVVLPLLGMFLCGLVIVAGGTLAKVILLDYLVGILFPLLLLAGLCFAILGIGLLFGWPLLFAAISVDGSDGFDAVSRCYSYVYQRPLQYLLYVFLAVLLGMFGWIFVGWFVDLSIALTVSWGGIPFVDFSSLERSASETLPGIPLSQRLILFWCWCFQLAKVGFLFAYFWSSTTTIYLLLRRSVDGTPFDEIRIYPNAPPQRPLPPIKTDAKGAPELEKSEAEEA